MSLRQASSRSLRMSAPTPPSGANRRESRTREIPSAFARAPGVSVDLPILALIARRRAIAQFAVRLGVSVDPAPRRLGDRAQPFDRRLGFDRAEIVENVDQRLDLRGDQPRRPGRRRQDRAVQRAIAHESRRVGAVEGERYAGKGARHGFDRTHVVEDRHVARPHFEPPSVAKVDGPAAAQQVEDHLIAGMAGDLLTRAIEDQRAADLGVNDDVGQPPLHTLDREGGGVGAGRQGDVEQGRSIGARHVERRARWIGRRRKVTVREPRFCGFVHGFS